MREEIERRRVFFDSRSAPGSIVVRGAGINRWEQSCEERSLFEAFIETCPNFADEQVLEWSLADCDPPDVIATTVSGKHIGIEIVQLAHEREMSAGKLRERIDDNLQEAIGCPQPINKSKNFWLAVYFPKSKVHIAQHEYPAFRESLFRLIEHVDQTWPPRVRQPHYRFTALAQFPPINKYLEQVQFVPGTAMTSDVEWIVPVRPVHWFNDSTMVDPLLQLLSKKHTRCNALKTHCDSLHLVIAHSEAILYGSPITARGLQDVISAARGALAGDRGPFSRAFLFIAADPGRKIYRLL